MTTAINRSAGNAHAGGVSAATHYRTATIDGLNIFYREAGPKDAPVVLLLHGFPSSSHMFHNLIPSRAIGERCRTGKRRGPSMVSVGASARGAG